MSASVLTDGPAVARDLGSNRSPAPSVLELIVERVRLRGRRRLVWLQYQRGEGSGNEPAQARWAAELDGHDLPEAEARWFEQTPEIDVLNRRITEVEAAIESDSGGPLQRLELLFRLSQPESDLLQACLALRIDPSLGPLYTSLQPAAGQGWVTDALVARLFGHGRKALWSDSLPLAIWGWVKAAEARPGEASPLDCDPIVREWFQGEATIDAELLDVVSQIEPQEALDSWPVEEIEDVLTDGIATGRAVRIILSGPAGSGRRTLAAAVAKRLDLSALAIDLDRIQDENWNEFYMRCQRLALLFQAALVWHGENKERAWPARVPVSLIQFVVCEEDETVHPSKALLHYRVTMPVPSLAERGGLLERMTPETTVWSDAELNQLICRYNPSIGHLAAVARKNPKGAGEAATFLRELTRDDLGDLGQLLDCPYDWDDLVLPDPLMQEFRAFVFEATDQTVFWERAAVRRLFGRGRGLVGLITGSPGTGKTMSAQVVAAALDLDLVRIDLASTVSKYIGETAKHLKRIFKRAQRMNAVLFFDEADGLFTKRTEVRDSHDRYANMDTNYLLQLLEDFQGIALLASNKRGNIDSAFMRRMRYVFHLPSPSAELRLRIWRRLVAELEGERELQRLEASISVVAEEQQLSGAQIKNAILGGIFIARGDGRSLDAQHLLRGVDRELGKEGRRVGVDLRARLQAIGRRTVNSEARDA